MPNAKVPHTKATHSKVPRSVCWTLGGKPQEGQFVTHVRIPLLGWRWPLPAPMPASWVSNLTWTALICAALVAALVWKATGWILLGASAGLATVWLVGCCMAGIASRRLRREAYAVMEVLHEMDEFEAAYCQPTTLDWNIDELIASIEDEQGP